jgi:Mrp family chromosome partitioning ATPase
MGNGALHLQQMMKNYRSRAKVLAVTSGKGGGGKNNTAAKLSNGPTVQPNDEFF